jgi:Outer membrane protein beta-barrel domain
MKRVTTIVAALVFFFLVNSASAQFGILGGLNLANASVDPLPTGLSTGTLSGFGGGIVLSSSFVEGFGLNIEGLYLQKGTTLTAQGIGDYKLKANYIEVPVMLTYTFSMQTSSVGPYIMAGPSFGYRLSAKEVAPDGTETDFKDNTKSTDVGATFGAGVKLPVNPITIFLEARYTIGFTNINNTPNDNTTIKTKGIQIFVGIML